MGFTCSTATIISSSVRTTITQIITAPSSTITSTSEVIIDNRKRAPAPTPAVEMPAVPAVPAVVLGASSGGDPYLSASVSSACSCLFIPLSTTRIRTTVYAVKSSVALFKK